ncbi:MAG: hypothetical protein K6T90_04990 [Leptolyngbyaceae cyanobacterium HOT.MB2.61]|jgi:hypothetical protein|nr:hypothetical protein [Leptolyngbyaceae cyanobacterium HOT.MB2.61]
MKVLSQRNESIFARESHFAAQNSRSQIKQELRQKIYTALQSAKNLPPEDCLKEIETRLLAIQSDCRALKKTFIVVEEKITCDQYELGGSNQDTAILFRGPAEDASVAICVTAKGSLLHRNGYPWTVYRNAGDVDPIEYSSPL